ncbi:hypothetical protein WKE44_25115 [Klebsiella pneumoniae]|uniref:hypothetical protein n=1 Tax=Klebsiella pneumoniae TaxID=573 RepID=UPI0030BF05BE
MAKFRKKPVVIDAVQYSGSNALEIHRFTDGSARYVDRRLLIPTLEGDHEATKGDWIIRGVAGEFYPCKPDIFEATYEAVN